MEGKNDYQEGLIIMEVYNPNKLNDQFTAHTYLEPLYRHMDQHF